MLALSPKQLTVLAFIRHFMGNHGLPPTRGEIAQGLGLKNRQGIDQHLRALESKGAIELVPGISRGIRLHQETLSATSGTAGLGDGKLGADNLDDDKSRDDSRGDSKDDHGSLPLLGRIAAGSPILAESNIEDYLKVDPSLFSPRANFMLRVRGDSMKDADILDRDLLAVHRTSQARNGHIVVARIGDEATVKYYQRHGHTVRLEPANPSYQPIEVDLRKQELNIEGLAVGVLRTGMPRRR
jgi:repressor LexA